MCIFCYPFCYSVSCFLLIWGGACLVICFVVYCCLFLFFCCLFFFSFFFFLHGFSVFYLHGFLEGFVSLIALSTSSLRLAMSTLGVGCTAPPFRGRVSKGSKLCH